MQTKGGDDEPSILRAFEEFTESRVLAGPEDRPDRAPLLDPDSPRARKKRTLTWQEIPAWQQDNEYILTGYRRCVFKLAENKFPMQWAAVRVRAVAS